MPKPDPTLADVLTAYERTLIAKVQLEEFRLFGGGLAERFQLTIEEHAELERRYLAELRQRRQEADRAERKG